jgi:hypothetical protein
MATSYNWSFGYGSTTEYPSATGGATTTPASALFTPAIILFGESTPIAGTDAKGATTETAIVEVSDFPQNAVIDNFNRADGILTSPWVGMTVPTQTYLTPYVASNQASTGPPGNGCGAYRSDLTVGDCEAYIDLPNPSECQYHDVWLRFTGGTDINSQNGYYLRHDSTNNLLMLQKCTGGATSSVGNQVACAASPGDSIGARVLGTTFSLYYKPLGAAKWRILGTGVDATYQNAASIGFFSPYHPALFDNFGGGAIKTLVSAADTNGTTTESGSYKGQYSDVDATGINEVEVVSVVGKISDTDATGINEVEVATPKVVLLDIDTTISESETATATPATQVSGTDANAGFTEAAALTTFPTNGLQLHFDASTLALANGAAVSPWPNLAQPSIPGNMVGTPAPTFQTGQVNDGKGVVRFRAGQGMLRATGIGVSTPFTLAYVAHYIGAAATQQRIVSTDYPPNNFLIGFWGPSGGPGYFDVVYDGAWASGEPSTVATLVWKLYSADQSAVNVPTRLFSDGTLVRSGGSGSQNFGGTFHLSGQDPTAATESSDCEVAEVFLYNRQLTDQERQTLENYLRNKWFRNPQTVVDSNATVSETTTSMQIRDTDSNGAVTENAAYTVNVLVYEPDFVDSYNTLANLYSPYSSIPATFSSYNTLTGAPLPLPVLTETATFTQKYSDVDSNGTTTETAALTYAPAGTDAGSATESASVVVSSLVSADAGTATEAAVFTYAPASADVNSTTTESASITREQITATDTNGSVTEAGSATAKISDVDAGTSAESASYQLTYNPVSSSDVNGTTTESGAIRQTTADVNSTTTETQALVAQALVTTDTGTGSDTQILAAGNNPVGTDTNSTTTESATLSPITVNGSDSGTSTESATVKVAVSDSDGGTVASETVTTNVPVSASDVAGAAEAAAGVAALPATDAGSATETEAVVSQISAADSTGATAESASIVTHYQYVDTDSATASEVNLLTAKLAVADVGSGTDLTVGTAAQIAATDQNGVVTENAALVTTPLISVDFGATAETASVTKVVVTSIDDGTITEIAGAGAGNAPVSFDYATIIENASLGKYAYDSETGLDSAILHAWLSDDDFGMASDTGGQYSPFPPGDLISGKITRGLGGEVVPALAGDIVVQEHVIQGGIGSKLDGDVETIVTGRIA